MATSERDGQGTSGGVGGNQEGNPEGVCTFHPTNKSTF